MFNCRICDKQSPKGVANKVCLECYENERPEIRWLPYVLGYLSFVSIAMVIHSIFYFWLCYNSSHKDVAVEALFNFFLKIAPIAMAFSFGGLYIQKQEQENWDQKNLS